MRFRRREAGKTSAVPPIEDVPFFTNRPDPDPLPTPHHPIGNNIDQLQKAERILGITHPLSQPQPPHHNNTLLSLVTPNNARQRPPPSAVSAPEPAGHDLWSQSAEQEYQPMGGTAPSANGGLKPWPSLHTQNLNPPAHTLRAPQDASHRNKLSSKTSHSTLHSQFETAQQNSSRDMGLRKVRSGVPSSKSAVESNGRPLKSAMRRPSNDPEPMVKPAGKKEGGMRMPKFANFLPRHNSSNRSLLQPSQLSQYGSSLSVASASPSNANFRSPSFSHGDALLSPASGSVTSTGQVGYLPQDPRTGDPEVIARDRILSARGLDDVVRRLRQSEVDMGSDDPVVRDKGMRRYEKADAELHAGGGYAAESEAATIASSLGWLSRRR